MVGYKDRYRPSDSHLLDALQPRPTTILQPITRDLMDAMRRNPHLRSYVDREGRKHGVPSFYKTLSRDMRNWENPQLIYPVGDPIFIHIFPDKKVGSRLVYRVIEPKLPPARVDLLQKVEGRIVAQIDERLEVETQQEKLEVLMGLLDRVAYVSGSPQEKSGGGSILRLPFLRGGGLSRIPLTSFEYQIMKYLLHKNRIGLGILEPLIRDPYIEDISCDGVGPIFLEHKIFQSLACDFGFDTKETLNEFALWLSERSGHYHREVTAINGSTILQALDANQCLRRQGVHVLLGQEDGHAVVFAGSRIEVGEGHRAFGLGLRFVGTAHLLGDILKSAHSISRHRPRFELCSRCWRRRIDSH